MSRVGKYPIEIPQGVTVDISGNTVTVKGKGGELSTQFLGNVKVTMEEGAVKVTPLDNSKFARSMWGTVRSNIQNLVKGVTEGFKKDLELRGVGYRVAQKGNVLVLSLGYSHVLHQRVVGGLNLEGIYARGPQDNPYRRARNGSPEIHPLVRKRLAPSLWMRIAIPEAKMVLEPRYRYYVDDWAIRAHSIEGRVHFRPQRDLQLRLLYRYYTQTQAFFWRDDGVWADEYPYRSDDPKMDDFRSHTIGGRLIWALDGISKFQGLGWLAGAWIEATYNHVFVRCRELSSTCLDQDFGYGTVRSTRYGDHRVGNLAFSLAF